MEEWKDIVAYLDIAFDGKEFALVYHIEDIPDWLSREDVLSGLAWANDHIDEALEIKENW